MDTGYYFDNVLVGSDPAAAAAYRTSHWAPKLAAEVGLLGRTCADLGIRVRQDNKDRYGFYNMLVVSDQAAAAACSTSCWAPKPAAEVTNLQGGCLM